MNANTLPIDVLPIPRAQPEIRPSGNSPAKIKDWGQFGGYDPQVVSNTRSDNILTGRHRRPTSKEVDSSDNNCENTQPIGKRSSKSDFKDVLKRQVETEKPVSEQAESEDVSETKQSESKSDSQQVQPATGLQALITVLAEQGEQKQANPNPAAEVIPSATQNQPVNPTELIKVPENPKDSSKLAQPILDTSQTIESAEQPAILTTTEQVIAPQNPQPGKVPAAQDSTASIVNRQVQENITKVIQGSIDKNIKTKVSQEAVSVNKPIESESLPPANNNTQLINTADQPGQVKNEQSAALPAETIVPQEIPVQAVEPKIEKDRRQGGVKQNTDQLKENSSQDKSTGQLNSKNNRLNNELVSNGLADRLGIEKVELINGKDGSPNSNPVNFAPLISRGALASDTSAQIAENRPIIANTLKAGVSESAARDVSASIREQITQSVQSATQQGARQITIQLNPPELGRVSIKFSEKGTELSGQLEVTNPQTRAEIRQAIPEILRTLEQSGISIKRIDVSLSDLAGRSNQESPRDNLPQQLWEHSANNGFNEHSQNHSSYDSYSASLNHANVSETSVQSSFSYSQQQSSPSAAVSSGLDVLI